MGFDNECILNIQSLAGEYFCPVCRTLVYPHEALQTQCTHLYCKPCLTYVVNSTQACPYDGYLVTEAGSKPLVESNKALADTIGKTSVHCLYHRSGCTWQGPLSECTPHCSGCTFGNSPVVCNRCGIQIVHRQVQEHAQTCNVNGTNTQPQQGSEIAQDSLASIDQSKIANQAAPPVSQPPPAHAASGPLSTVQNLNQPATVTSQSQPQAMPAVQTPEQWFQQQQQQQYQQYYQQQYPGYDPYQQQYYLYQQAPAQQFQQPPVQVQTQPPAQQFQQPPLQPQLQPLPQPQSQSQPLYPQPAVVGSSQNPGQVNPQQPMTHGPMPPQSYPQPHMQVPQYQQPPPQMHHSQPPQPPQFLPVNPQHPPVQYPAQPPQQIQHPPPQQHPMQVQPPAGSLPSAQMPAQFPPPPSHMRPTQPPHMLPPQGQALPPTQHVHPHSQPGVPPHQRPVMQPMAPQYVQQPQGQLQGQMHQAGPYVQQHPQVRPQGPPQQMQQPPSGFAPPPHGMPPHQSSQNYMGRPSVMNSQQFPQPSGAAPQIRPPQFGQSQPSVNQPHTYSEQPLNHSVVERKGDQQDQSPSIKKPDSVTSEVKPETGVNDENDNKKDESLAKDQGVQADCITPQSVKEETKDGSLDQSSAAKLSQIKTEDAGVAIMDNVKQGETSVDFQGSSEVDNGSLGGRDHMQQGQPGDVSGGFANKGNEQSSQPSVPYGQQQRPAAPSLGQPPSHLRPPGPSYFQPPGPFHPEFPPNSFANNNRGYEPQSVGTHGQYNQSSQSRPPIGDPMGLPHGPDGPPMPRHPGPMETDMYQNQRPSHVPYGQPPFGAESNPIRMNGGPPPPGHHDTSSAPAFHDDKFRETFPMGPNRHHEPNEFKGGFKQFPGPPHLGNEGSPKFGNHSSRFLDKDPYGYGYHSGPMHDDNRGRFDNHRQNPDFLGPMHGYNRHHMDRLPPTSPGHPPRSFGGPHNMDLDERHPYGERFPLGPPGHMHRGDFDGPIKPRNEPFGMRNREPFGSFPDYGRSGESNGPFGESFGNKSGRGPHLGEPGFRSSYSRQGFDGGFYAGGPDSFDQFRKRKPMSMGWCRICKIDCESVEGLDMHGQTREHQRMAMDMVISIKQKTAKKQKGSSEHSARDEGSKLRNADIHARVNIS